MVYRFGVERSNVKVRVRVTVEVRNRAYVRIL